MASFSFAAADLLHLLAKILSYAGALGAVGAGFFLRAFDGLMAPLERAVIRRYAFGLLVAALVGSFLMLFGVVALLNGRGLAGGFDGEIWAMVATTPAGDSVWLRLAGLAGLLLGLLLPRLLPLAMVLGGLAVALSFGFAGHVRDHEERVAMQALLIIHLLGIAFWIGSLWPLLCLARADDRARIADIMVRFGELAAGAVAILVVAGCGLAWVLLEDLGRLVTTDYGRVLLVKLVLVALLLGLAALNKTRLVPSLAAGDGTAVLRLQRSIRLEIAAVALIFAVTAVLTSAVSPQ